MAVRIFFFTCHCLLPLVYCLLTVVPAFTAVFDHGSSNKCKNSAVSLKFVKKSVEN